VRDTDTVPPDWKDVNIVQFLRKVIKKQMGKLSCTYLLSIIDKILSRILWTECAYYPRGATCVSV